MTTIKPLLSLNNVRIIRDTWIIGPVTFELEAGQILLLEGPNGCGKSTLLKAVAGITVQGVRVTGIVQRPTQRPMLPQESERVPFVRISDVKSAIKSQSSPPLKALTITRADSHSPSLSQVPLSTLRLLALELVLATKKTIVFLDEPFEGLDSENTELAAKWIRTAHKAGTGFVISDHSKITRESFENVQIPQIAWPLLES